VISTFERELAHGWVLRKIAHCGIPLEPGRAVEREEHELQRPQRGILLGYPKWEWADWDRRSLVWAESGCLYRAPLSADRLGAPKMLHDFNAMKFEAIKAPY